MDEHLKDEILKLRKEGNFPGFMNDHLNAPDRYQYDTADAGLFFMNAFHAAIEEYDEDRDWLKMAKGLWAAYSSYVGLGYSEEQVMNSYDADPRVVKLYREKKEYANALLARLFEASFDLLYQEHPADAVAVMQQVLKKIRIDRATEASLTRGQGKNIEMYDYFLTLIEDALSAPRPTTVGMEVSGTTVSRSFENFCLEKIKLMPEEERKAFLAINSGESSFLELRLSWMVEYNKVSGKKPIKSFASPISRAKRSYKELRKS